MIPSGCFLSRGSRGLKRSNRWSRGVQAGNTTTAIRQPQDLIPADHLQFRVIQGGDFAWAYLTRGRRVIETTGLPQEKIALCLDMLLELPGVTEIVDQHDDRRLDELERDGLM